ncbi:unnamed protein product [Nippostrongylus brasiliensis]|uniref:HTH_48 domain-containing protein n=1 Tax=Nippostrongylus brasiliensis TaxID=27835 RepID=A0A0N4XX01_NIPBR|nr:unnamed protein product [Nippostrongylus brasiliensis]
MVAPHLKRLTIIELQRAGHSTTSIANLQKCIPEQSARPRIDIVKHDWMWKGEYDLEENPQKSEEVAENPQKSEEVAEGNGRCAENQPIKRAVHSG